MALTAAVLMVGGFGAGVFGALLGLGGGVLIVPLLSIAFGYPLSTAVGTSLIAVIATSSGAAAHYVRSNQADVRLGLTLELATALGAIAGGLLAALLVEEVVAGLFAILMFYTAYSLLGGLRRGSLSRAPAGDATAPATVPPNGSDRAPATLVQRRMWPALGASGLAGAVSALLGVGGGVIKVPVIHLLLGAPMPVAVATSNLMVGMTAAAGAFFYVARGDVDPTIAGPVVLGVFAGAAVGSRVARHIRPVWLIGLFVVVLLFVGIQMAARAVGPLDLFQSS